MTNEEAIKILSHTSNLGYGVVIEAMEGHTTREIKIALDMAIEALGVRPQGEWIDIDSRVSKAMCSNCKNIIITEPFGKPNYCPNCGADMRPKPNQLRDCENCVHHSDNGCEVWECEFKRRSS